MHKIEIKIAFITTEIQDICYQWIKESLNASAHQVNETVSIASSNFLIKTAQQTVAFFSYGDIYFSKKSNHVTYVNSINRYTNLFKIKKKKSNKTNDNIDVCWKIRGQTYWKLNSLQQLVDSVFFRGNCISFEVVETQGFMFTGRVIFKSW